MVSQKSVCIALTYVALSGIMSLLETFAMPTCKRHSLRRTILLSVAQNLVWRTLAALP